jgi:hypothetical protein
MIGGKSPGVRHLTRSRRRRVLGSTLINSHSVNHPVEVPVAYEIFIRRPIEPLETLTD